MRTPSFSRRRPNNNPPSPGVCPLYLQSRYGGHETDVCFVPIADIPHSFEVEQITNRSWRCSRLVVCSGLLRFEFLHRGVEIGRSVMRAPDGFDMTAVAERAAVVQASLFDDVVHVVDELGPAIPTRLNIARN